MPAFTSNQWVILFLVLVLGWVLGLASRSGGRKWKRALEEERAERAIEQQRHADEIAAARARIAELERPAPVIVPAAPVETRGAPVAAPLPGTTAAFPAARRTDDLSLIRGIGPVGQERLNEQDIRSYRDIRAMNAAAKADLEARVGAPEGTIDRDRWQDQAAILEEQGAEEHRRQFP